VKWVINFLTSCMTSFFLSSLTSSLTTFVCKIFLNWICQHWLLYDKLSSNNINNNNNVSVIWVCVLKCLEVDSSQSPHSLWCICCCSHSCSCWCWFSFLCWSAAAHSVCSLFSNNGYSHAAQCEHSVHMRMYHIKSDKNLSVIVHQCNFNSESKCVDFCWLY